MDRCAHPVQILHVVAAPEAGGGVVPFQLLLRPRPARGQPVVQLRQPVHVGLGAVCDQPDHIHAGGGLVARLIRSGDGNGVLPHRQGHVHREPPAGHRDGLSGHCDRHRGGGGVPHLPRHRDRLSVHHVALAGLLNVQRRGHGVHGVRPGDGGCVAVVVLDRGGHRVDPVRPAAGWSPGKAVAALYRFHRVGRDDPGAPSIGRHPIIEKTGRRVVGPYGEALRVYPGTSRLVCSLEDKGGRPGLEVARARGDQRQHGGGGLVDLQPQGWHGLRRGRGGAAAVVGDLYRYWVVVPRLVVGGPRGGQLGLIPPGGLVVGEDHPLLPQLCPYLC